MSLERARHLVGRFRDQVRAHHPRTPRPEWGLPPELGRDLLESMLLARELDTCAHELRSRGLGHYTICSTGHEANVVLGRLTGPHDPSIVHYRSAALQVERARQVAGVDPVRDIVLSLIASSEEPISGGRHKVFGSKPLGIIPSTSTIASQLPRALGLAFALERAPRVGVALPDARSAIALVSFGDASLNHSTALGALNATSWTLHQNLPVPLLFVCEDNGLGISVRTPEGWVETRLRALPHVEYFRADGADLDQTFRTARAAVEHCRRTRRAAVLHLGTVRLLGHAGSDVDTTYRPQAEIDAAELRDPVLCAALDLIDAGAMDPASVLALQERCAARVGEAAVWAVTRPRLSTRAQVMAALVSPVGAEVAAEAASMASALPAQGLTLAQGINTALGEAMARYPESLVFGEDVAKKGGVYGVTKGLFAKFGRLRVFNTLLDEQTILGLALGTATAGLLPVPEIQYLAYLHNAEDQLRGEAASMQFFSDRAYDNPMVVRIAGLAYQKGFGGHFHNDNSLAVLRDIPGVTVLVPARADDALELYRTAFALAKQARRVVVVIEPIALYHTRDLHAEGDGEWAALPPVAGAAFGEPRVYRPEARDLVIATYGNGLWMSLRAARRLEQETGARARVLDLRWLVPLPERQVVEHARECGRLLVVDECRKSGNVSEALAAAVLDAGLQIPFARVAGADSYIPLGDAANLVLVDENEILAAARELTR
ncbi:MAG: thiamine pyrophosphate-dependent enzyme [Polyangiaceae bacterium]|nr:thiamine pyrophosphate-dependent enzyme [Polyangiaceae bacterium]